MYANLTTCKLFNELSIDEIKELFEIYDLKSKSYANGDVIAIEGNTYTHLLIVIDGIVHAETADTSNRPVVVERITPTSLIAPSYLFAENSHLPVSLLAKTEVMLVAIEKDELCLMMSRNIRLMTNFLSIMSSSNKFVSDNIMYLTYKTIKSKYSNYLLNRLKIEGVTTFRNDLTQRQMAELFGVTRPALARAIKELADEGAIYVKGKEIMLLYPEKLEQYARES